MALSHSCLSPPPPPQLPPTTNGSSSGTLGCPATITSSRLGEAVDWPGEGSTAGARVTACDSRFSLPVCSQLLVLSCSSVPLRLCPVATCPDDFLLAGCEGGCCCWDVRLDQPQKQRWVSVPGTPAELGPRAGCTAGTWPLSTPQSCPMGCPRGCLRGLFSSPPCSQSLKPLVLSLSV